MFNFFIFYFYRLPISRLGFKIGVGVSELGLGFRTEIRIQGRDWGSGLKLGFRTRVGRVGFQCRDL